MSHAASHINRATGKTSRKQRRTDTQTTTQATKEDCQAWADFMATMGYKIQEGPRPSTVSDKWTVKVCKVTFK